LIRIGRRPAIDFWCLIQFQFESTGKGKGQRRTRATGRKERRKGQEMGEKGERTKRKGNSEEIDGSLSIYRHHDIVCKLLLLTLQKWLK